MIAKKILDVMESMEKVVIDPKGWSEHYRVWIDEYVGKRSELHNYRMNLAINTMNRENANQEIKHVDAILKLDKLRDFKPEIALEKVNQLPEWIKREFKDFIDKRTTG